MQHAASTALRQQPSGRAATFWPQQQMCMALKQRTSLQMSISTQCYSSKPSSRIMCSDILRAWTHNMVSRATVSTPRAGITSCVNPRQPPPVHSHPHSCPPIWNARASHPRQPASSGSGAAYPWRQHRYTREQRWRGGEWVAAAGGTGNAGSMNEGEEGDLEVSRELESFDIERFRRASVHLDLMWKVEKGPKPEPCDCCAGTGQRRCEFCHGTGAMMVGEERFCSLERGCKPCPVCHSTGEVKCQHCNGTGFRASWLEPGCPLDKM